MSTLRLPDVLRQLAYLADVRGSADAADMRTAVALLDTLSHHELEQVEQSARRDRLSDIPGFPPSIGWLVAEISGGGAAAALRAARAGIPTLLRRLLELGAATHDQVAALAHAGIVTLSDLEAAIDDGRLRRFPEPAAARLTQAAEALALEVRPIPLGRAWDLTHAVIQLVNRHCMGADAVVPAGDTRRFEPLVSALVVVGRSGDPAAAIDALCGAPGVEDVLHRTGRRAIITIQQGAETDVRIAAPDDYGSVLFAATGARAHVRAVSERRGRVALYGAEQELYAHVGLEWIPPEVRHANGEIEAAAGGGLPRLVERSDMRGDLHMHSTYSDGQDTVERMVQAAIALGYEYIAISDHSESATASRSVTLDQLARQRDEIARLREMHPEIDILHGIEVEILPDGRLDFADAVLERLDIVLASLHDAARQDGQALTRRCLQALQHPLVNVLTHPANRLVGRRGGYPLNYPAIYEAAAATGTALEIDGAPSHLDLDGEHARAAVAAGVTVTIDSDCHRAPALERQMLFGIGTARRGWVEPRHVLNCRPAAEVRAFVLAKRQRNSAC